MPVGVSVALPRSCTPRHRPRPCGLRRPPLPGSKRFSVLRSRYSSDDWYPRAIHSRNRASPSARWRQGPKIESDPCRKPFDIRIVEHRDNLRQK